LLINAAIVSTRSRDLRKMERAYRRLEAHLPSECQAFFQQASHQVAGLGFSPEARTMVHARHAKWTSRARA
jgi:anthranilate/para-aminobenzoate synthase component I